MSRALCALTLCFYILHTTYAQDDPHPWLKEIRESLAEFKFRDVIENCNELLSGAAGLTRSDSLELYRLSAISHFSLFQMTEALNAFGMILSVDPEYRLDVLDTPPKIITYFNSLKRFRLQTQPDPLTIIRQDTVYRMPPDRNKTIAYSLLFPGLGHLYHEPSTKGWMLVSAGAISLAAAIYFSIDSADKEDAYLREINPVRIEQLYTKYNDAYRYRNISYALFGAIWVYSQMDLLLFQEIQYNDSMTLQFRPGERTPFSVSFVF